MSRLARIEALKSLLADRDHSTVAELAAELGVSLRTLHRDIAVLRELGLPVDSDRGRGGGIRLEQGWSLGRVHLNESEAIGLLLSLTIAEKIGSPLLLEDTRSIARKIGVAFAPAQARRILALRRRILVGSAASSRVLSSYIPPPQTVTKPLLDAFAHRRLAVISYSDQSGSPTEREIELQYLYYSVPVWYALSWDRLRNDVRSFRIDRIRRVKPTPDRFAQRPGNLFLEAVEPEARLL